MQIKFIANLAKGGTKLLVLNNKPVNLNRGLAKKALDETLSKLEKNNSPFIDYGVLRFERSPEVDKIKITSSLENEANTAEFNISVEKSKKNKTLYKLENGVQTGDKNIAIKERLYSAFTFIHETNKLFRGFDNFK